MLRSEPICERLTGDFEEPSLSVIVEIAVYPENGATSKP
jgi:hypothetical protein